MNDTPSTPAVGVHKQGHVAIVEIRRPPHNYFDAAMIQGIADAFEALEGDAACRAIVLCSQGTAFCAGANFATRDAAPPQRSPRAVNPLYFEAIRLVACTKPVIAAVHGPAIGGGLGLALAADFRVTCAEARFSANFNRLGIHPGFGLSYMLPRLVGQQQASLLFYTGRRIAGEEAVRIGLAEHQDAGARRGTAVDRDLRPIRRFARPARRRPGARSRPGWGRCPRSRCGVGSRG